METRERGKERVEDGKNKSQLRQRKEAKEMGKKANNTNQIRQVEITRSMSESLGVNPE